MKFEIITAMMRHTTESEYTKKLSEYGINKISDEIYSGYTKGSVEINTLEELLKLVEYLDSDIIIKDGGFLVIYDDYLE